MNAEFSSLLSLELPKKTTDRYHWGRLYGSSMNMAIADSVEQYDGLTLIIADDAKHAAVLEESLAFFIEDSLEVLSFPDWETLPYDLFSPLPEIVSQRLKTLSQLPSLKKGALIVPVTTLLQRLAPQSYLDAHVFILNVGDELNIGQLRQRLEKAGYLNVKQVLAHGEFAQRGSLFDIFPMGCDQPFRIDLFDVVIESIRTFDPETQRTLDKVEQIELLPAREFPLDKDSIHLFKQQFGEHFDGYQKGLIFNEISQGQTPTGIEYYMPLFFQQTAQLFDFLPAQHLNIYFNSTSDVASDFYHQVEDRYEQRRFDTERPVLEPRALYLNSDELMNCLKQNAGIMLQTSEIETRRKSFAHFQNFATRLVPPITIQARATEPAAALRKFLSEHNGRVLFIAESAGRREQLHDTLNGFEITVSLVDSWFDFLDTGVTYGLTTANIEQDLWLENDGIAIITESQLLGERVRQERRRKTRKAESDQVVRNLTELTINAPVVHEEHGIGRYLGLQTIEVENLATEFLTLEYAKGDKLYVPVAFLHLISRYSGASPEHAPLHRLGGDQWARIKRKAADKIHDIAAELLEIHAQRAAKKGYCFPEAGDEYAAFSSAFEFEETPDQQQAIDTVLKDMNSIQPMDRVVCGDVGFGKTEVAMRACFTAVQSGKQVAILAPTTLLAQQHYQNFADRFADWPFKVEGLSRFRTSKQQNVVIAGLLNGTIDIVIGTHKLFSKSIQYKDLGLVIIDEEHRFGVRQKEALKSLRSEVDILTLTATPIPRTLNMAMSGLRDLSIIATPPSGRHPIKTFVSQWENEIIQEACLREMKRGGQIYFLHNEVKTIANIADKIATLVPHARVQFAHGQMREQELEGIMRDFYHQRFNILVATTIIESGIDIPTANTIIINRADKLGMAQLHQLRGRVGRSHHRAYAYLLTPPIKSMTKDALKRLEAIEAMEDLGAGFTLATHDLEIRGAGELLGDEQSGQIHEIGFTLYSDLLDRAVAALKSGDATALDRPLDHGAEINLNIPTLLPDDFVPDVHTRLVFYKRIANAQDPAELHDLQVEMIDRFGLLPEPAKSLFDITELKLKINPIGIIKVDAHDQGGRIIFNQQPKIDPMHMIQLIQTQPDRFKFDGNDKIRFFADLEDRSTRVEQVIMMVNQVIGGSALTS